MSETRDLLLEIGCEELPASFVDAAVATLPELAKARFGAARIAFSHVRAFGTPRRLALLLGGVPVAQPDLAEELTGPPVRAAFKDGEPTRAALAFAEKLGVPVGELRRVETPKGEYLVGTRRETGRPSAELLPELLDGILRAIPFRKSMRWADLDFAFGRPIQWLVALFGADVIPLEIASIKSGRLSRGHRFLSPGTVSIGAPAAYVDAMRAAHVLVDPAERREALRVALGKAAVEAGGTLIEDEFLMGENASLVEEPYVVVGGFSEEFLDLPERVILEVAKGHQRYFGVRAPSGKLLPKYLAVVNTALEPALIRKGNDRVMRARLADARFFYQEDLRVPLESRREKLGGVVFQKRLGTVLEKADRVELLAGTVGKLAGATPGVLEVAREGARLAKCDLVSLMVGEFPELQGEMGSAYAVAQGTRPEVAEVIREHYRPKGASDDTAKAQAAALVALADRLDSLVGCFAIGLTPSGAADPFGLRRATLGILRTMMDQGLDLSLVDLARAAYEGLRGKKLDLGESDLVDKLIEFAGERLRGLLAEKWPADVVRACLAAGHERPLDVRARVVALAGLDETTRAKVGEVFKRATNIAEKAPPGEPGAAPSDHPSEAALFSAYARFAERSDALAKAGDYVALLREVATIAPIMHQYFTDIFVMDENAAVREPRLRLMRSISERCTRVARLELLSATQAEAASQAQAG
ncbi:MAG: glycine--tRNA ligase subunit beta [Myxococcales bacterium]|nr:glycine--tRNA ligase subunit beta [Myxococcales bacterium]